MTAHERLREQIDEKQRGLRAGTPPDREAAIVALLRVRDRLPVSPASEPEPDVVTGHRLPDLGGNRALQIVLDTDDAPRTTGGVPDGWAEGFLGDCCALAEAEMVLAHVETGFMRVVEERDGTFDAWIATKRVPTRWRERADIDWWAAWLARRHAPELRALQAACQDDDPALDAWYRRLADVHLEMMAYQLGYTRETVIGGLALRTCLDVLAWLISRALRARDRGEAPVPCAEHELIAAISADLALDPTTTADALSTLTLDQTNAAWHAPVPGVAAAPLVRVAPDRVLWSLYGLQTEPIFFLTRELRRRDAPSYHNVAYLREGRFRENLAALFGNKRFVTSTSRVELRREAGGARTDIDAVVFDRKTGTLGLFELKSQDPFARSTAELVRQRDNILHANRQLSGILAWVQRHGGDEVLRRVDARTAKTFRVHRVLPFVLGRYLAHFEDGPEPDRRAAWGTWPQVLRLLGGEPAGAHDANPLATLHARLRSDAPGIGLPDGMPAREIAVGEARLVVHSSYAAYQASAGGR